MFSLGQSAEVIIWTIVGGLGTLVGPIVGAIVLGYLKLLLGQQTLIDNSLVLGAILVLVVLLLPSGLLPALAPLARAPRAGAEREPAPGEQHARAARGRSRRRRRDARRCVDTRDLSMRFGGVQAVEQRQLLARATASCAA